MQKSIPYKALSLFIVLLLAITLTMTIATATANGESSGGFTQGINVATGAVSSPGTSGSESSGSESSGSESSGSESSGSESSGSESSTPGTSSSTPESSTPESSTPESSTPESSTPESSKPQSSTPQSSSSSNNTSGGGGGGGGGAATTTVPGRSSNVSSDGSVSTTTVTNELKQALKTSGTDEAVVAVKNAESISAAAIKSLAKAASDAGKQAVIHADTLAADGSIQGRLYVDPAKLSGISGNIKLGIATQGARPESRKNFFEKHFSNKVAVISCAQQGSFGAKLKMAAKVNLPGNGKSLVFYSFDSKTNKFKKIDTTYRIDKNGFVHFETEFAGDIIISDKPLTRK